jgi:aromatic-L-amino-acid/L-tryptophan decarboxylase
MSTSLDITGEALRELSAQTTALVFEYFERIRELPVFPDTSAAEINERLHTALSPEGEPLETLMADCRALINASRHNGHPRFFGYVASPSTPIGAYADLIASALNQNVTSWRSAPAATRIEQTVIRWLSRLIGYGEDAHGLLMSGGSLANLNALFIALRIKGGVDVSRRGLWNRESPMTIYASDQAHFSIVKAADALGLGRDQVRLLKADGRFRLDARLLREHLDSDIDAGFKPFCVVANAGTVSTGAVDPLDEIATVTKEYDLWLHVDGAYGALAAMDESKRPLFRGIERADSVSLDPHKWLYAPVDAGCLLFRDEVSVRAACAPGEADYIKVQEQTAEEAFAFWDYGLELSRRFRALKIWLMLRYYGTRRVSDAIAADNILASELAKRVTEAEDFELLAPAELSICCFRHVPPDISRRLATEDEEGRELLNVELDELNAEILRRVQRGGRAYVSNATIRGRYALRACITNFRTTSEDIMETLEIVREAAGRELNGRRGRD